MLAITFQQTMMDPHNVVLSIVLIINIEGAPTHRQIGKYLIVNQTSRVINLTLTPGLILAEFHIFEIGPISRIPRDRHLPHQLCPNRGKHLEIVVPLHRSTQTQHSIIAAPYPIHIRQLPSYKIFTIVKIINGNSLAIIDHSAHSRDKVYFVSYWIVQAYFHENIVGSSEDFVVLNEEPSTVERCFVVFKEGEDQTDAVIGRFESVLYFDSFVGNVERHCKTLLAGFSNEHGLHGYRVVAVHILW